MPRQHISTGESVPQVDQTEITTPGPERPSTTIYNVYVARRRCRRVFSGPSTFESTTGRPVPKQRNEYFQVAGRSSSDL